MIISPRFNMSGMQMCQLADGRCSLQSRDNERVVCIMNKLWEVGEVRNCQNIMMGWAARLLKYSLCDQNWVYFYCYSCCISI